jgi:hypothetical protein
MKGRRRADGSSCGGTGGQPAAWLRCCHGVGEGLEVGRYQAKMAGWDELDFQAQLPRELLGRLMGLGPRGEKGRAHGLGHEGELVHG